jgi:hypothetical protein
MCPISEFLFSGFRRFFAEFRFPISDLFWTFSEFSAGNFIIFLQKNAYFEQKLDQKMQNFPLSEHKKTLIFHISGQNELIFSLSGKKSKKAPMLSKNSKFFKNFEFIFTF